MRSVAEYNLQIESESIMENKETAIKETNKIIETLTKELDSLTPEGLREFFKFFYGVNLFRALHIKLVVVNKSWILFVFINIFPYCGNRLVTEGKIIINGRIIGNEGISRSYKLVRADSVIYKERIVNKSDI